MVDGARSGATLADRRMLEATPSAGGADMSNFWGRAELNPGELGIMGEDEIRIREGIVQWGDQVTVLGTVRASTEQDQEARAAGAAWIIEGRPGRRLRLADRPPDEWAASAAWGFLWAYIIGGVLAGMGAKGILARAMA